jgi:acylphosphatase
VAAADPHPHYPVKMVFDMLCEIRLHITGLVQGVGFRLFLQDKAAALGIKGIVRNLADGSVEVVAQGAKEDLRRLVSFARLGPAYAQVEDVRETWQEPTVVYTGFRVR